jgi:hypothetical protein
MADGKKISRTQIIVAIIGLIGALGGALIANWDKVYPPREVPTLEKMFWNKTDWDNSLWQ